MSSQSQEKNTAPPSGGPPAYDGNRSPRTLIDMEDDSGDEFINVNSGTNTQKDAKRAATNDNNNNNDGDNDVNMNVEDPPEDIPQTTGEKNNNNDSAGEHCCRHSGRHGRFRHRGPGAAATGEGEGGDDGEGHHRRCRGRHHRGEGHGHGWGCGSGDEHGGHAHGHGHGHGFGHHHGGPHAGPWWGGGRRGGRHHHHERGFGGPHAPPPSGPHGAGFWGLGGPFGGANAFEIPIRELNNMGNVFGAAVNAFTQELGASMGGGGAAASASAGNGTATANARAGHQEEQSQDFRPEADVFDTPTAYLVHLSLPGALKEDIGVSWDPSTSSLEISGVVHRPGVDEELLRSIALDERRVGAFERKIRLGSSSSPALVDAQGIAAKLEHGILMVEVPKLEKEKVENRKIEIS